MGDRDQYASYAEYRAAMEEHGERYVRFVQRRLEREGHRCVNYRSKSNQIGRGDLNVDGEDYEVKNDRQYRETGNLFIELHELARTGQFVSSGIDAGSRARWYWIGDYHEWFLFERVRLRTVAATRPAVPVRGGSGNGFLLRRREAYQFVTRCGEFTEDERIEWMEFLYEQAGTGRTEGRG